MSERDIFDNISPIDFRYFDEDVSKYLSENAFTRYKLAVELALVKALHQRHMCTDVVVKEVEEACKQITTAEVYEEEKRTNHDIRALVHCIRNRVSDITKPFVHMMATSYDIIDTANVMRYRDVVETVLVPSLTRLEEMLIDITLREADTVQIGRTHGQHAVPITFGFSMAGYVNRLGGSIEKLKILKEELSGKFSGAVGAHNAQALFFDDPEAFEAEVLATLELTPAVHSTQIVPPEALMRLLCEVTIVAGILANLADDMRHLQRTEIGEVGEGFGSVQVGSSTMPQKRNPITFENVKSGWKIVMSHITTIFMDQISEHQRDLTNSASARTYPEIVAYTVMMAKRLTNTMQKIVVDHTRMRENLEMTKGGIAAEPLYITLAALGHHDAHEKVRALTLKAQEENRSLQEVAVKDIEIKEYLVKMTPHQLKVFWDPSFYTGIASRKARAVAEWWKQKLAL